MILKGLGFRGLDDEQARLSDGAMFARDTDWPGSFQTTGAGRPATGYSTDQKIPVRLRASGTKPGRYAVWNNPPYRLASSPCANGSTFWCMKKSTFCFLELTPRPMNSFRDLPIIIITKQQVCLRERFERGFFGEEGSRHKKK